MGVVKRIFANKNFTAGLILIAILVIITIISLFWTPYVPTEIDQGAINSAPSGEHWGGTDKLGRRLFQ